MAQEFDRDEWLRIHKTGIGGSEIAPIMNMGSWGRTALDVYQEKVSPIVVDLPPTPDMKRGNVVEKVAAELYAEETGRRVRRQSMRRHKQHPFLMANVDRQQVGELRPLIPGTEIPDWMHGPGILEIKCPRGRTIARAKAEGLPLQYSLQMQHYLEVFGYGWGTFCLFDYDNFRTLNFDVERDPDWAERIVTAGTTFWEEHVMKRVPPPELEPVEVDKEKIEGEIKAIAADDEEFLDAMKDLWEARDILASAVSLKNHTDEIVSGLVKARLGGYGSVETLDHQRVHYKFKAGSKKLQKKVLQLLAPLDAAKVREVLEKEWLPDDVEQLMDEIFDKALIDVANDERLYKADKDGTRFTPYRLKQRVEE